MTSYPMHHLYEWFLIFFPKETLESIQIFVDFFKIFI